MDELIVMLGVALPAALAGGVAGYRMARNVERQRSRAARHLLRTLVEVADSSPFAAVAHVVEHCLPDARALAGELRDAD